MSAGPAQPSDSRVVWFYWGQGLASAPPIVQLCHRSWVRRNPGWDVRLIDSTAVADHVTMPTWTAGLTPQQYSDVLRLRLLEQHGGVWVDATTFCNAPLDDWLAGAMPAGFFAFARPNMGQSLDSWFLATDAARQPVVVETRRFLESYFAIAPPHDTGGLRTLVRKITYRVLSRRIRTSEWWFSRPVRIGLRIVPYYAIHYAFNRTLRVDAAAREAWARTPKISADGPHLLWKHGLDSAPDQALLAEFAHPSAPLYKLSWRHPAAEDPDTVLGRFVADRLAGEGAA